MSNHIRWGILGLGKIARKFSEAMPYAHDGEIIAVGSKSLERAKEFSESFGIKAAYGSYEELVKNPDVDVVYIATPHVLHASLCHLCLDHGKAVLCEKPFAMNYEEAHSVIEKARQKQLFVMEALWTRFMPPLDLALQWMNEGKIGDLLEVHADFGFQAPFDPEKRIYNPELGGGSLLDVGIYPVFLSYLCLGKPNHIQAMAQKSDRGVDLSCLMNFSYPENTLASLSSSVRSFNSLEALLIGSEGKIKIHNPWHGITQLSRYQKWDLVEEVRPEVIGNGFNYEIDEVHHCLKNARTESKQWSWQNSLDLMELLDAVRKEAGIYYPNVEK